MTFKNVAIFGSGPSGLLAAHAAYLSGAMVTIFSKGAKSELHGCQYLHREIPELPIGVPSREVEYRLQGTPQQYREKVYGPQYDGPVSVDSLTGNHYAWDIRTTYDWLWHNYVYQPRGRCVHTPIWIKPGHVAKTEAILRGFDFVISTIPASALCNSLASHGFAGEQIWALGQVAWGTDDGLFDAVLIDDDKVICCGEESPSWYRASRVFGVSTVEWPGRRKPPIPGVVKVTKPLGTNCNCFPFIHRMGRYGAWDKTQLTHHVFEKTMELLNA